MALSAPKANKVVLDAPEVDQVGIGTYSRLSWIGSKTMRIESGFAGPIAAAALERYGQLLSKIYVGNGTYNPGSWQAAAGLNESGNQLVVPQGVTFFLGFSDTYKNQGLPPELEYKRMEGGLRIFEFGEKTQCYNFSQINLMAQLEHHKGRRFGALAHRLWGEKLRNDTRANRALNEVYGMTQTGEVIYDQSGYYKALVTHNSGVEIGKYVRRRIEIPPTYLFLKPAINFVDDVNAWVKFKPCMDEALPHFGEAVENGGNMFTSLTTIQLAKRFLEQMKDLFPSDKWLKFITFVDPKLVNETAYSGRAAAYFDKMLVVITGVKK